MKYYKRKNDPQSGLYEASTAKNGNVDVFPQGGGFAKQFTPDQFAASFEEVDPVFPYKRGEVTADFLPDHVTLPCISDGRSWNGWGLPLFERAIVERLLPLLVDEFGRGIGQWEGDTVLLKNYHFDAAAPESEANPKFDRFNAQSVTVDGVELVVWAIGDGYCWNSVAFEKDATPLYKKEFPDFGELDVTLPWDFTDVSDHIEDCPSFLHNVSTTDGAHDTQVLIWVDHADPAKRKNPRPRFTAMTQNAGNGKSVELHSDDWAAIVLWVRVEIMKAEILQDVQTGRVPASVSFWGDLDDHVDANCYGGFCEDNSFPEGDGEDGRTGAFMDWARACQDAVNVWIMNGGITAKA